MAPNAGDRHFRVFRVPASVFQVPVGGDGRPLADVLRGERAPMDALHRRPEAACPNVWQRIGVSEHDGRQAGAGPRSRNRLRAWERARRFMGTAVRPSFLTDHRDDMGVASFRNAACRKGRGNVFCQVVIGQCGVSFPSEKAVGFSPVRNWPVIARVLLFHCIRA